jgi:hypothetical protein
MRLFLLSLFLFVLSTDRPSKKEVEEIINERAGKYNLEANWYAKNDDSIFYKSDTVKLVKHLNYMYHADSNCRFIQLRFDGNYVDIAENKMCFEPTTALVYGSEQIRFRYTLKEDNEELLLLLDNKSGRYEFQIISLQTVELWQNGDKARELTLVRQKY